MLWIGIYSTSEMPISHLWTSVGAASDVGVLENFELENVQLALENIRMPWGVIIFSLYLVNKAFKKYPSSYFNPVHRKHLI